MTTDCVTASELATLLDRVPAGVQVLSLDCFDTLIWRNCHAPTDVFTELDEHGGTYLRSRAERRARQRAGFEGKGFEVAIEDIYRCLEPEADEAAIAAGVARELELR